jgi:alpha-1,6-mannosyltransferase
MALPAQVVRGQSSESVPAGDEEAVDVQRQFLVALLVVAAGMEAVVAIFVRRLSLNRIPDVIPSPQPVANALGITEHGLTWFVIAMATLVLCHAAAFAVALRLTNPRYALVALAASVLLIATMVPIFPGGAQDVYHNIVDARTLWTYHQDPITTTPAAHPSDPFVRQLAYWQDLSSSYGPVWYLVSGIPLPFAGNDMIGNVIGQKILVSAFLAGTLYLIYLLMKEWRPQRATAAIVLMGWSPLVLWEIPGNAHNDIVMMFFAVAALLVIQRGRWQWAFPLLALAVAVKFIMLLLGPLLLVWLLFRKPRIDRREIALSIGAGGAILAMIYLPFIAASHSFANYEALQSRFISSPASLTIAFLMQYTSLQRAEDYGRALALTLYACGYLWALYRCRGGFENLVTSACWATFFTLALPTWWFWPWYVVWLLPIAAMVAGRRVATLALLFGSTALLVYPIYYWRDVLLNGPNWYSNQFVIVGAVFGPIALYLAGTYGGSLFNVEEHVDTDLTAA